MCHLFVKDNRPLSVAISKKRRKNCNKILKISLRIIDQDKNNYGKHRKQRS